MKSICDTIEDAIISLINERDGVCQIVRNAMAAEMNVTPSQITYVLSTRFTQKQGFLVESRRGGSGFVRIRRVPCTDSSEHVMRIVRSLPEHLGQHDASILVSQLLNNGTVSPGTARLMLSALSDRSFGHVSVGRRDAVRADICKNILTCVATLPEGEK